MLTEDGVTQLLHEHQRGNPAAVHALARLIYSRMRRLAGYLMRGERQGHTLQPTALANEAFIRIFQSTGLDLENRVHFQNLAAKVMRHVLREHARKRAAAKRGGGLAHDEIDDQAAATPTPSEEFFALNEAIDALAVVDARQAETIEIHYFSGLSVEEIAGHFGISGRTVKRDLDTGRLFLRRQMLSRNTPSQHPIV